MSDDRITFDFACITCGADPATLSFDEGLGDAATVTCKDCGQDFGTYGDLKAKMMDLAKAEIASRFKKAFKGRT